MSALLLEEINLEKNRKGGKKMQKLCRNCRWYDGKRCGLIGHIVNPSHGCGKFQEY